MSPEFIRAGEERANAFGCSRAHISRVGTAPQRPRRQSPRHDLAFGAPAGPQRRASYPELGLSRRNSRWSGRRVFSDCARFDTLAQEAPNLVLLTLNRQSVGCSVAGGPSNPGSHRGDLPCRGHRGSSETRQDRQGLPDQPAVRAVIERARHKPARHRLQLARYRVQSCA